MRFLRRNLAAGIANGPAAAVGLNRNALPDWSQQIAGGLQAVPAADFVFSPFHIAVADGVPWLKCDAQVWPGGDGIGMDAIQCGGELEPVRGSFGCDGQRFEAAILKAILVVRAGVGDQYASGLQTGANQ